MSGRDILGSDVLQSLARGRGAGTSSRGTPSKPAGRGSTLPLELSQSTTSRTMVTPTHTTASVKPRDVVTKAESSVLDQVVGVVEKLVLSMNELNNRMKTLDTRTSGMDDVLRNIADDIVTIKANMLEVVHEKVVADEQSQYYATESENAAARLSELGNSLLTSDVVNDGATEDESE